jgi:hypothetical protein
MLNADADTDEMLTTTLSPTTLLAPLYILVRLEHMTSHNGVGRRLTRVPMLSWTMRKKLYFVGSVCKRLRSTDLSSGLLGNSV